MDDERDERADVAAVVGDLRADLPGGGRSLVRSVLVRAGYGVGRAVAGHPVRVAVGFLAGCVVLPRSVGYVWFYAGAVVIGVCVAVYLGLGSGDDRLLGSRGRRRDVVSGNADGSRRSRRDGGVSRGKGF